MNDRYEWVGYSTSTTFDQDFNAEAMWAAKLSNPPTFRCEPDAYARELARIEGKARLEVLLLRIIDS